MLGAIILVILLASPFIATYLGYDPIGWLRSWFGGAGGPSDTSDLCGSTVCKPPTPICVDSKCVGCRSDTDCPLSGPRIVHGYSLAAGATPDRTVDADTQQRCVIEALNSGSAVAQYRTDAKKCDLFTSATGLTAAAPEDPARVLIEIGAMVKRK
jgi:hypothetical protein